MKEAAGEANMTVITIVLIAIVLAVGTVVVTRMMNSTGRKSVCSELGGTLAGNTCTFPANDGGLQTCTVQQCGDTNNFSCGTFVTCPPTS